MSPSIQTEALTSASDERKDRVFFIYFKHICFYKASLNVKCNSSGLTKIIIIIVILGNLI